MGIFAAISGLNELVRLYPAANESDPGGVGLERATVKIGPVRYRACVTVGIGECGLFLGVYPPFGRKRRLLIPWREIKGTRETRLYGRRGVRMSIGEPPAGEVSVYQDLFELLRTYLPPPALDATLRGRFFH